MVTYSWARMGAESPGLKIGLELNKAAFGNIFLTTTILAFNTTSSFARAEVPS